MVLAAKTKKPAAAHHKKRTGKHSKRNPDHHKAYLPYLPMLALVGLGFILNLLWQQPGASVLAYATSMSPSALLQETNAERSKAGQRQLALHDRLTSAAQAKAEDMATRDYWSHVTPDGKQPWWFVSNAGYDYQATGENLAYGFDTSLAAVTGWMNSAGHRANILNAAYQDVGFGIANATNYLGYGPETIVVAMYGTPYTAVAKTATTPPAAAPVKGAADSKTAALPAPAAAAPVQTPAAAAQATPVPAGGQTATAAPVLAAPAGQRVARLQLVADGVPAWSILATTLALAALGGIFILRHLYFWHRALVRSERFIIRHWKFDLVIIAVVMVGAVLTRTAGFIQ